MDGASCHWTNESMDCLADMGLKRTERDDMKNGVGDILYAPTHRLKRTPESSADGTVMDSGVIRHFKLKLRKRLSKEDGGRRQVLNKDRMMEICEEVWDAIKIEELRPYFDKLPKTWAEIKKTEWGVGWVVRQVQRTPRGVLIVSIDRFMCSSKTITDYIQTHP